jgi:hypothetical protein
MSEHASLVHSEPFDRVELVRPFIVTGGRTRASRTDLRWETLLECRVDPLPADAGTEQTAILERCAEPTSIAEIAAATRLPLAVTTILAADLLDVGWIRIHETDPVEIELSALTRMIERVRTL